MSYCAVSDRIVLIPDKLDGKIDGIIIPDSSKDKPKSGVVESVGPLCREAKPGYKILFLEGHGAAFTEDGVNKLVLKEADVLCMNEEFKCVIIDENTKKYLKKSLVRFVAKLHENPDSFTRKINTEKFLIDKAKEWEDIVDWVIQELLK